MQAKTKGLTFGADIEFSVRNLKDKSINYATGFFGGTKEHPIQFPNQPIGFMYQEDGAMLELNIPISHSVPEFKANIEKMVQLGKELCAGRGFEMLSGVTVSLDPATLGTVPLAWQVGCSPDWDAYTENQRHPFTPADLGSSRHAGGHIHVGYPKDECPDFIFVRAMDYYLRLAVQLSMQVGAQRTQFYGYEGLYRPKEYGIEYRTLCTWPLHPSFSDLVYDGLIRLERDWSKDREAFIRNALSMRRDHTPNPHVDWAEPLAVAG